MNAKHAIVLVAKNPHTYMLTKNNEREKKCNESK
jgi:hypothetical protein